MVYVFQDLNTQFTCKIYFAKEFDAMRANVLKPPRLEKSLYKELELSKKREEIRLVQKNSTIITTTTTNMSELSEMYKCVNKMNDETTILPSSSLSKDSPSSQQQQQNQQQSEIEETRIALARSLCRSVQWEARGGKSGSKFSKTLGKNIQIH